MWITLSISLVRPRQSAFKLTSLSPNQLVFENPTHDFPTKITYLKISQDSIVASISGLIDGKEKLEQFPMKKIK